MARAVTFSQSPDTVLPTELNTVQDDYEDLPLMSMRVADFSTQQFMPVGDWMLCKSATSQQITPTPNRIEFWLPGMFWFDPNDFESDENARRAKLRLTTHMWKGTGATGQTCTFTIVRVGATITLDSGTTMRGTVTDVSGTSQSWVVGTESGGGTFKNTTSSAGALVIGPALYAVRMTVTGTHSGADYVIIGQINAFVS